MITRLRLARDSQVGKQSDSFATVRLNRFVVYFDFRGAKEGNVKPRHGEIIVQFETKTIRILANPVQFNLQNLYFRCINNFNM